MVFFIQYMFFPLAHEQVHDDNGNSYQLNYFFSYLNIYRVSLRLEADCDLSWIFFLSDWKYSLTLKWFTVVTLRLITIAAVWKHGFRSLVCKCLFPYNPAWSGTHIRYLTCETHVTLADDLADLENYSCLVTLKTTWYKWFTRLGHKPFYADWWEFWPFREREEKKHKTTEMCHLGC